MRILAIDPGDEQSALVLYERGSVLGAKILPNVDALEEARHATYDRLAVEMVASYGMPVGREIFDTCVWIGRFIEAAQRPHELVFRMAVKMHLCDHPRAKDATIRQALIDRYGGKRSAIGNKKAPGPLYGIYKDMWSALAVAVTFYDAVKEIEQ